MDALEPREPLEMQTWRWPEPERIGPTSSRQPSQQPTTASTPEPQQPEQGPLPGESPRSLAIRSTFITLLSTALSASASFGFGLDEAKSTAVISVATAASALVALFMSGRRGRG